MFTRSCKRDILLKYLSTNEGLDNKKQAKQTITALRVEHTFCTQGRHVRKLIANYVVLPVDALQRRCGKHD